MNSKCLYVQKKYLVVINSIPVVIIIALIVEKMLKNKPFEVKNV